jgi:hypothetical protein
MSTISALKVFSLFGKKSCSTPSKKSETPRDPRASPAMGSIPAKKPGWLQEILDGHQQALNECKQTNENIVKKFDDVVASFRTDFGTLDQKQSETTKKVQEITDEVAELKTSLQIHQTDISAIDNRVDATKEEMLAKIDELREEFEAKLAGKAAPHPDRPVVPSSTTVGEQCRIDHEFSSLLAKARNMVNQFAMGRVTGVVGIATIPKTQDKILADYFSGITITVVPSAGKSQVKRFCVQTDQLATFQANLELYKPQIRAEGWWISVDLPPELRSLRSNAFQFFKEARSLDQKIRAAYLDISHDSGYVTVDGLDLVPVYLVPRDKKKWPTLIMLLARIVDSVREVEWTVRITTSVSIDSALVREWADVVGVQLPARNRTPEEDIDMLESRDGG